MTREEFMRREDIVHLAIVKVAVSAIVVIFGLLVIGAINLINLIFNLIF